MAFSSDSFAPATQIFVQVGQTLMQGFMDLLGTQPRAPGVSAPSLELPDPEPLVNLQKSLVDQHQYLWNSMLLGESKSLHPGVEVDPDDRRFLSPEWKSSPVFDYVLQLSLIHI